MCVFFESPIGGNASAVRLLESLRSKYGINNIVECGVVQKTGTEGIGFFSSLLWI